MITILGQKWMSGLLIINAMKRFLLLFIGIVWFSFTKAKAEEPYKRYRGYVDFSLGEAYNPNAVQRFSTNNMQWYAEITTTHGYALNNWFVGAGLGYYHSFRDKENMYPIYAVGRYTFEDTRIKPYVETRLGIVYDPRWIQTVQTYGALSAGISVYKRLQVGVRLSMFSRPSRYFTANAAVVLSYEIGK